MVYQTYDPMIQIVQALGVSVILIVLGVVCIVVCSVFIPTYNRKYRRIITDLYIVGKVRQFADNEKIDLNEEWNRFITFCKKRKISDEDLDKTIERDIQEKIADESMKAFKEKSKEKI